MTDGPCLKGKNDPGDHVAIIGAGQAGGTAASALRQYGYEGKITLIGEEPSPPYQRPPLSKAYFKGDLLRDRLYLRPETYYREQDIDLRLSECAESLDPEAKTVTLSDGKTLDYCKLILATGSRPRLLPVPGADLDGVYVLRTLEDVDRLRLRTAAGRHLVVIGAGYIGLEVAAVARQLGLEVTVLEALNRVLARVAGPIISEFYQQQHRKQGVDIRLNANVEGFAGENGQLSGVMLTGGEAIKTDMALIGIGIAPNQELAQNVGLRCDSGVVTDYDARTSDPDIFAIGDCARRPLVHYARMGRLESVHNALEQAMLAAAAICGKPRPKEDAPWFWSDQYDLKLQTAGLLTGYDEAVVRDYPEDGKFAVYYLKSGQFLAVDAVNSSIDFMCGKKLVGSGAILNPDELRTPEIDIKVLTKNAKWHCQRKRA